MPTIADRLDQLAAQLSRIETRLAAVVPPRDVRASMAEATEHIADMTEYADATQAAVPLRDAQIDAIIDWIHARMSGDELRIQFEDQEFVTRQLISIMQGTRTDIVEMRSTLRQLTSRLEQTLHARVVDEEAWNGAVERRNSIADRRRAG